MTKRMTKAEKEAKKAAATLKYEEHLAEIARRVHAGERLIREGYSWCKFSNGEIVDGDAVRELCKRDRVTIDDSTNIVLPTTPEAEAERRAKRLQDHSLRYTRNRRARLDRWSEMVRAAKDQDALDAVLCEIAEEAGVLGNIGDDNRE